MFCFDRSTKKSNKARGSLTVEATLILPFVFISWLTIINFLNVYFVHTCIQQALNNTAKRLSEYAYIGERITMSDGSSVASHMSELYSLDEDTENKANHLVDDAGKIVDNGKKLKDNTTSMWHTVQDVKGNLKDTTDLAFDGMMGNDASGLSAGIDKITANGQELITNLQKLDLSHIQSNIIQPAKEFKNAIKDAYTTVKSITGDNLKDYFVRELTNTGSGLLVGTFVNMYIKDLNVQTMKNVSTLNYSQSRFFYGDTNSTFALVVTYRYNNPFNIKFFDDIKMKQVATMNMWIGDMDTDLRKLYAKR